MLRRQNTEIIENLKSEVDSQSTKEEKHGQTQRPARTVLERKLPLVHEIKEEKEEIKHEVIINTPNNQLDLEIIFWGIERTQRTKKLKKQE